MVTKYDVLFFVFQAFVRINKKIITMTITMLKIKCRYKPTVGRDFLKILNDRQVNSQIKKYFVSSTLIFFEYSERNKKTIVLNCCTI